MYVSTFVSSLKANRLLPLSAVKETTLVESGIPGIVYLSKYKLFSDASSTPLAYVCQRTCSATLLQRWYCFQNRKDTEPRRNFYLPTKCVANAAAYSII